MSADVVLPAEVDADGGADRGNEHEGCRGSRDHSDLFLRFLRHGGGLGLYLRDLIERVACTHILRGVDPAVLKFILDKIKIIFHDTHSKNAFILASARERRERTVAGLRPVIEAISRLL